jgi:uncharacterized protein (TIGR02996 family)
MTHDDAFLQAICEEPDDDTPRLIYADWLEEQGDADRAEFIRVQVQLARLPPADERRRALKVRERGLLKEHETTWAGPLRGRVESWKFRRGFIEQITTGATKFLTKTERLFRLAPIRQVRLRRATWCLHRLAACPFLSQLQALDLGHSFLLPSGVRALVASPHLRRLTSLNLPRTNLNSYDLEHLASAPALQRLTTLDLSENNLGAGGAGLLASAPVLSRLTTLRLNQAGLGNVGVALLAGSPHLRHLTALELGWNELGGPAAEALAGSPNLAGVVRLDLSGNRLSIAGANALAASPYLRRIARLGVTWYLLSGEARQVLHRQFGKAIRHR